jgi:hypothetical protein
MNTKKCGGYGKLLVFFLVAAILIFAFGLVADGWQNDVENNSGNVIDSDKDNDNDEADENKDAGNSSTEGESSPIQTPTIYNKLTGTPLEAGEANSRHVAFVIDTAAPLYGVSSADIIIELPTENGQTRLAVLTKNYTDLGKTGAIAPTKGYINSVISYFDTAAVYFGKEGIREYDCFDLGDNALDLSVNKGYHYTEFSSYNYSNGNLITAALASKNVDTLTPSSRLPFIFSKTEAIHGQKSAKTVVLPFSDYSETELYFRETDKNYTFAKNESVKQDLLTSESVSFKNVFVLFADAVTYEDSSGCELILDTVGSGSGYYASMGVYKEFYWTVDEMGNLSFTNVDGSPLEVNPGASYIGYLKSSHKSKVSFN